MYGIIWEYKVKAERQAEFEKIYASDGAWVELFRREAGFIGTELLRDEEHLQRFLTIDKWASQEDDQAFRTKWKKEYEALDAHCEGLTERESPLGNWEALDYRAR